MSGGDALLSWPGVRLPLSQALAVPSATALAQAAQWDRDFSPPELLESERREGLCLPLRNLGDLGPLDKAIRALFRATAQRSVEREACTHDLRDSGGPCPTRAGLWGVGPGHRVQVREASAFPELNFSSLGSRTLNTSPTLAHGKIRPRAAAPLGSQYPGRCPLCAPPPAGNAL